MSTPKDAVIRARFDYDRFQRFKRMCEIDGTTSSDKLRELVDKFIDAHPMSENDVRIHFEIHKLSKQNKHAFYTYIIEANIFDEEHILDLEMDIPFMLPEFVSDEGEPYRVDSHHQHRTALPNDKSKTGRYLGSKFIEGTWKGAIYIYDDDLLLTPNKCFVEIKRALELKMLGSISNSLQPDNRSPSDAVFFDEIFTSPRIRLEKWDESDDEI